jgi:flagellar motor switch protein FliM
MSETVEISQDGLDALIAKAVRPIDRLPGLQAVTDRLPLYLAASLRALAADDVHVSVEPPRSVRFRSYLATLTAPAAVAVIRFDPWNTTCLAILDAGLSGLTLDLLLGGCRNTIRPSEGTTRPFTAIERAVVERLTADVVAGGLSRAFEAIARVNCLLERIETAPGNAAIAKPGAAAVAFRAEVRLGDRVGCIDFLIPLAALDPVKDRLGRDPADNQPGGDSAWRTHLQTELPQTKVRLRAVIESRQISTADILHWRPGSHLPLNRRHDEPIQLFCGDLPVLHARIGEKDGRIALHVEQRRLAEDWPTLL